ncbi:hypothetical protein B0H12DRAFT_1071047 [Mycena haematopus]|nr:hypothetical protein B0H12DRAFT_1071047 [Mycena haematopus]
MRRSSGEGKRKEGRCGDGVCDGAMQFERGHKEMNRRRVREGNRRCDGNQSGGESAEEGERYSKARETRQTNQPPQRCSHRQQHHIKRVQSDSECEVSAQQHGKEFACALRVACVGLSMTMEVEIETGRHASSPSSGTESSTRRFGFALGETYGGGGAPNHPANSGNYAGTNIVFRVVLAYSRASSASSSLALRAACPPGARRRSGPPCHVRARAALNQKQKKASRSRNTTQTNEEHRTQTKKEHAWLIDTNAASKEERKKAQPLAAAQHVIARLAGNTTTTTDNAGEDKGGKRERVASHKTTMNRNKNQNEDAENTEQDQKQEKVGKSRMPGKHAPILQIHRGAILEGRRRVEDGFPAAEAAQCASLLRISKKTNCLGNPDVPVIRASGKNDGRRSHRNVWGISYSNTAHGVTSRFPDFALRMLQNFSDYSKSVQQAM